MGLSPIYNLLLFVYNLFNFYIFIYLFFEILMSNSKNNFEKDIKEEIPKKIETENINDQENIEVINKREIKYEETPYRWFFLVAYFLLVFQNQFQWVTFSAIATDFSKNYDQPLWKVNMFSLIYMIVYPFVCIPEGWLIDDYSIRFGFIITSACNILGAGLKLLVNKDKSLVSSYIGQILNAILQPALLNSPGKIAANWFRDDIRNVICTICCLSINIGALVGFLWNVAFINENVSEEKFKDQCFNYLLSEFILCTIFCIPTFFINKDKPEIPPSPSQNEEKIKRPGLIESLKLLFTNKNYIYLIFAYFFVIGYFYTISTVTNSLLDLYTITGKQSSIIYAVSSIFGMFSSLIVSWLLDKYKKFKLFMILLCVFGTIFQALFTILLELIESKGLNAFAIGLIVYSLINIVVVPFFSIGMNYACEITFPVGESINGSIIASMPQLSGIGGTFLLDHFISNVKDKKWISNVILLGFFALSCVCVFLLDDKLVRHEIEKMTELFEKDNNKTI